MWIILLCYHYNPGFGIMSLMGSFREGETNYYRPNLIWPSCKRLFLSILSSSLTFYFQVDCFELCRQLLFCSWFYLVWVYTLTLILHSSLSFLLYIFIQIDTRGVVILAEFLFTHACEFLRLQQSTEFSFYLSGNRGAGFLPAIRGLQVFVWDFPLVCSFECSQALSTLPRG